MIIINDCHLGTQRQAGTTPMSQLELKQYIRDEFRILVDKAQAQHLAINGDMFDGFTVDPGEVIYAYEALVRHIHNGGMLTLIMGNHDASAKGDKTSSFHLLSHVLKSSYPIQARVIDNTYGLTRVEDNVWAISHQMNQSLFDLEIEKATQATQARGGILLLHCNVMSPFAEHGDHSLNLSEQQLDTLVAKGWTLIVGHEHQQRMYKAGKCIIPGNQIPTSISDCLNNKDNSKFYVKVEGTSVELVKWVDLIESRVYVEANWRDLIMADLEGVKFVRITGECSADEAADMVNTVSKLRQQNKAFVIGNAVKVGGVAQMDSLADLSAESISKFDVLEALLSELDEREQEVVKGLLK